jgi:hypothetical protein
MEVHGNSGKKEFGPRSDLVTQGLYNVSCGFRTNILSVLTLFGEAKILVDKKDYPLLIWGDYNSGTPAWYGLTFFTVIVISVSFIFAWIMLKSGSLWTGALLHASHNLYVQGIFTPLTRDTGKTAWFINEFGAILPLVALGFGIYFLVQTK